MKNVYSPMSIMVALSLAFLVTACSSSKERPEPSDDQAQTEEFGELGQIPTTTEDSEISGTREVVKTEEYEAEIPVIIRSSRRADINKMEKEDFVALGLSPEISEKVVEFRDDQDKFRSVSELSQVPGMDMAWLNRTRDKLGVNAQELAGEEGEE